MNLWDYISGARSGEKANRIERQAMRDPFLYEVLDGYDRVPHDTGKALQALRKEVRMRTSNRRRNLAVWSSVASLLVLVLAGAYFLFTNDIQHDKLLSQQTTDISTSDPLPENILSPENIFPDKPVTEETIEETTFIQEKVTPEIHPDVESISVTGIPLASKESRPLTAEALPGLSTAKPEKQISEPYIYIAGNGHVFGVVTDETGEPIIGASIVEKGTNNGIITDIDGYFALDTEIGKELEISYIGYKTLTVPVQEGRMQIAMHEDNQMLDEVVVIGYGIQKKSDLSGSISQVKKDKHSKRKPLRKSKPIDGYKAFKEYIKENHEYEGKAKVVLQFNINQSGRPENIIVKKSPNEEATEEAIYLLEEGPDWITGRGKRLTYTFHFR